VTLTWRERLPELECLDCGGQLTWSTLRPWFDQFAGCLRCNAAFYVYVKDSGRLVLAGQDDEDESGDVRHLWRRQRFRRVA
jgi:hypothetical protein